jgi:basic membrane protein A
MKRNLTKLMVLLAILSIMLTACQPKAPETEQPVQNETSTTKVEEKEECAYKIGYVSDVGKINDQSFNQASWTGVEEAAKLLGLGKECYSFIETTDSADYEINIRSFVDEGYNIIVTSGFAMGAITRQIAKENPELFFIGVGQEQVNENFEPDPYPNAVGLNFREDFGGFLVGALAGLMTETNVVGGVFGCQFIPPVARYEVGYYNGVKFVNPDAKVINVYHPGSIDVCFSDATFGSETAKALVSEGVDVLYGAGGLTANGALITACNQGAYVLGTDMDQFVTLPEVKECILSSALKDIQEGVVGVIGSIADGTFGGGDVYAPSSLAPFHNLDSAIPEDAKVLLEEIAEKLYSGEINPCTPFEGSNPNTFCVPIK